MAKTTKPNEPTLEELRKIIREEEARAKKAAGVKKTTVTQRAKDHKALLQELKDARANAPKPLIKDGKILNKKTGEYEKPKKKKLTPKEQKVFDKAKAKAQAKFDAQLAEKKGTSKKETAKKPTAKKPTAKKPAAKKPVAKKPTAKKPAAKKPVAKKSNAKVRKYIKKAAKVDTKPKTPKKLTTNLTQSLKNSRPKPTAKPKVKITAKALAKQKAKAEAELQRKIKAKVKEKKAAYQAQKGSSKPSIKRDNPQVKRTNPDVKRNAAKQKPNLVIENKTQTPKTQKRPNEKIEIKRSNPSVKRTNPDVKRTTPNIQRPNKAKNLNVPKKPDTIGPAGERHGRPEPKPKDNSNVKKFVKGAAKRAAGVAGLLLHSEKLGVGSDKPTGEIWEGAKELTQAEADAYLNKVKALPPAKDGTPRHEMTLKGNTSFGAAFKAARKAGKQTFKWQGKSYSTATKDDVKKSKSKDLREHLNKKEGKKPTSFGSAFAAAKKAGKKTFEFNGKKYSTKTK